MRWLPEQQAALWCWSRMATTMANLFAVNKLMVMSDKLLLRKHDEVRFGSRSRSGGGAV